MDRDNFLLQSKTAQVLYQHVKGLPIIDYHSHLSIKDIYEDRQYNNIGEMWLEHDHYKWRAMRACGIDEHFITGTASFTEKYQKWAYTMEYTLFNPLYHWSHLELYKYFGIDQYLSRQTADEIYNDCQALIAERSVQTLIKMSNVKYIATTDDPIDDLKYHRLLADNKEFIVAPTFRPDQIINLTSDNYIDYVHELEKCCDFIIQDINSFKKAITMRINYFKENNCTIADHGIDRLKFLTTTNREANEIFLKRLKMNKITEEEIIMYQSYIYSFLLEQYQLAGFVCQLHMNVIRNCNSKLLASYGPDCGCDSSTDEPFISDLAKLLDSVAELPKIIVYSLNQSDYYALASLCGNFQSGPTRGKIQLGSAWWHGDHIDGMRAQLTALAQVGLLRNFVGMLTDSRSFLSFSRHDYFRRVLCQFIAEKYDAGEVEQDIELMKQICQEICYDNAYQYFNIKED